MKIQKISVNRTSDKPKGVEIEIVQPETDIQGRLLAFLLPSMLREAKKNGRLSFELPDQFTVNHQGEGTFVVKAAGKAGGIYEQPKPIGMVGIRVSGKRFDLVHAGIDVEKLRQRVAESRKATTTEAAAS